MLDAISKDYGIDLDELRTKYMIGGAEPSKKSTSTTKTEKEKTPCIATTKKNKPCRRFAVDGSCHCKLHVRFIAEQQQQQQPTDVAKKSSPEKKKKKKMSFVSPDNFNLRREFDAVFEEIFEEEDERSEAAEHNEAAERIEAAEHNEAEIERCEKVSAAEVETEAVPPEMDFDDEATEIDEPEMDFEATDDEATEIEHSEAEIEHSEAEDEREIEIEVKFWKDAASKRPSICRIMKFEKRPAFDRVLDRIALDSEAADFVDRGFAIMSGKNVVMDLAAQVGDDAINVLARDDSDIEWRYLDDMPDIGLEAFLEKALLDCEQEEI